MTDRPKGGELAMQAGILCNMDLFHRWLERTTATEKVDRVKAGEMVRKTCGVDSRAMLDHDEGAAAAFREMQTAYEAWRDE